MGDPRFAGSTGILGRWLPVILWAAVIFLFSTDLFSGDNTAGVLSPLARLFFPGLSENDLALLHFFVRKFAHFAAYFILAFLVMRALSDEPHRPPGTRRMILAVLILAFYAVSDELHQSLVPSRGASVADVFIDLVGGLCGIAFFYGTRRRKIPLSGVIEDRPA